MNGQNNGKLGGTLIGLAIFQIVQTLFWLLFAAIMTKGAFEVIDENSQHPDGYYTGTQKIYLVLIPLFLLTLLGSQILSTIFIFLKRKAGIFFSYVSVAAAIVVPILFITYFTYLENTDNPSEEYNVGALIAFAIFGCLFWGTQLLLLLLPPSRRNVKESFR